MNSKLNWGRLLLSGASMAALGAVTPAFAQDDDTVYETIVVTATGRSAAIQDVPLAVTALTAESIENAGVTDIRDLEQIATSFKFYTGQSNSAGTTAYIRGIGTGADNPGFESAVGFFVDGVYRSRSGVALSSLPEVDRIEVLRGPQGTLFGRNTTAGAISVVTAGPEFDPHYWMSGTAGDLGMIGGSAGLTGPLLGSETVAYRLDVSGEARDGYIHDANSDRDLNDRNRWAARGQILWDISPDASLRLIADTSETDEECCVGVTLLAQPSPAAGIPGAINLIASGRGLFGLAPTIDAEGFEGAYSPNRPFTEQIEEWGVSGHLDWTLGDGMDFTSITSYRDWEALRDQDIDFSGIDRAYRDDYVVGFETITQEFRLHGEAGRIDWLVGAFYGKEDLNLTDTIRFGADANTYVDFLGAGLGGAQLYGSLPMSFLDIVGGTPGATPSALGAIALTAGARMASGNPNLTSQQAFGFAAMNPGFGLSTVYDNAANAFAATAGLTGEGQNDQFAVETTTMALFTHNEISLSDALTLTVGVRYNHEEKDFSATIANIDLSPAPSSCQVLNAGVAGNDPGTLALIGGLGGLLPLVCSPATNEQAVGSYTHSREDDEFSGVVSLAYDFTPDMMGYGSYSRGYKAGGYNLDRLGFNYALTGGPPAGSLATTPDASVAPAASDLEFESEFVDAYELGIKYTTLGGGLTLNFAAFLEQITDYQNNAFTGFNFQTFNVPDTVSKGAELEWVANIGPNFTWQGGLLYNEAYIDSTVVLPGETLQAGTPLDRAPEWTATSSFTYEQPIGGGLTALFYVDGRYQTEHRVQVLSRNPATDNDAYGLYNARVGIGADDDRWSLELFVDNLTDEFYHLGAFAVPEQTSGGVGVYDIYPGMPRTWGVTLKARY